MEEFRQAAPKNKENKVVDFISRVKGYIDVAGPNQKKCPYVMCRLLIDGNKMSSPDEIRKLISEAKDMANKGCSSTNDETACSLQYEKMVAQQDINRELLSDLKKCKHAKYYCLEECRYVRRAIILRSLLEKKLKINSNDDIYISDSILEAFLYSGDYKHGVRSIENIINLCDISPTRYFDRSCLPSKSQILMFADADFVDFARKD